MAPVRDLPRPEPEPAEQDDHQYNAQHSALVRQYIDELPEETPASVIKVKDIIRFLREHGLKGKERSMYSYTYDILKKEAKAGNLEFEKGVSYSKPVKINTMTN